MPSDFPSYEIIAGSCSRGSYFASDLRSVTDAGVDHVMRLFFRHATSGTVDRRERTPVVAPPPSVEDRMDAVTEAMCEEEFLDRN